MFSTILPLLRADLSEAYLIEQACYTFSWNLKTFTTHHGRRYLNFKLCIEGQIVAFAITKMMLDEASLFNIAVHPKFQRKGHARALLKHLITDLEARRLVMLWLEVRQSNTPTIALYRTLGFNEVSVRHHYYPSVNGRENAIIMARPLSRRFF
ncbi:ribosomal protein S18-alanine N-acetyltransferase [Candidatus Steffania adelgidicola]|uniref:ribosomal protein S18-alanine N-acetyltransferase n=1 Tax=Candidatus Steffania adelgidicola TaxID=1076626 RepID=UPI001D033087|nr:ribosomal protein S18-alanine N-acetyltransferase [Candidatus Steffania adelgidicola]UDG79716.1 Ribosomal-protein-alanine acetyltransferase [Candidatus Steffania adelgidicola]